MGRARNLLLQDDEVCEGEKDEERLSGADGASVEHADIDVNVDDEQL